MVAGLLRECTYGRLTGRASFAGKVTRFGSFALTCGRFWNWEKEAHFLEGSEKGVQKMKSFMTRKFFALFGLALIAFLVRLVAPGKGKSIERMAFARYGEIDIVDAPYLIVGLVIAVIIAAKALPIGVSALLLVDTGNSTFDTFMNTIAPIVIAAVFILLLLRHYLQKER